MSEESICTATEAVSAELKLLRKGDVGLGARRYYIGARRAEQDREDGSQFPSGSLRRNDTAEKPTGTNNDRSLARVASHKKTPILHLQDERAESVE